MPIQGTSADILKRALRLLHDDIRDTSAKLVNIVHDEIVVECDADKAEHQAKLRAKAEVLPFGVSHFECCPQTTDQI